MSYDPFDTLSRDLVRERLAHRPAEASLWHLMVLLPVILVLAVAFTA